MRTEAERRVDAIANLKIKRRKLTDEFHLLEDKIGKCDELMARLEVGEDLTTILLEILSAD